MDAILKNSKLNKVFAIVAAFLLAVSFSLTSIFAAVPTGKITVKNIENEATVYLYQIATVNWNDTTSQPVDPMYRWVNEVNTFIDDNEADYGAYNDDKGYVTNAFETTQALDEKTFLEDLATRGELSNPKTAKSDGTDVIFNDVDAGLYLIVVDGVAGSKVEYQVTSVQLLPKWNETAWQVSDATVNVKSVPDGSTKEVTNDDTVAIGDTVSYKITTSVPTYIEGATNKVFTVRDVLGQGLTLQPNTIKINGTDRTDEVATIDYGSNNDFTLTFTENFINANQGKTVEITYDVTVNENAFETDALGNSAFVGTNDPTTGTDYEEEIPKVEVYTYGITVTKVNTEGTVLAGAEFQLKIANGNVLKFDAKDEGVYTYNSTGSTSTLKTNADGKIIIQGIDLGSYTLTETKAPNGYVLPANPEVTINLVDNSSTTGEAESDGILEAESKAEGNIVSTTIQDTPNDNILEFGITNKTSDEAGFELPNTGGMGTLMFTVGGILLMAGAVIYLVVSKKKA